MKLEDKQRIEMAEKLGWQNIHDFGPIGYDSYGRGGLWGTDPVTHASAPIPKLQQPATKMEEELKRIRDHYYVLSSSAARDISILLSIVDELRSRLAEVEKEKEQLKSNEAAFMISKCKEVTWGCGHTNRGSCSRCLGSVTNERNMLKSKIDAVLAALADGKEGGK